MFNDIAIRKQLAYQITRAFVQQIILPKKLSGNYNETSIQNYLQQFTLELRAIYQNSIVFDRAYPKSKWLLQLTAFKYRNEVWFRTEFVGQNPGQHVMYDLSGHSAKPLA